MLINELFKGLQREIPFAFKSKDPPTALLWLTFDGSPHQRNMHKSICAKRAESLSTIATPQKSHHITRDFAVYLHYEKPCEFLLYLQG